MDSERHSEALRHTVSYSLFVLRTCVTLNGGAIIALLTVVTHQSAAAPMIGIMAIRIAIVVFAFGLAFALLAGERGYNNLLLGQNQSAEVGQIKRYEVQGRFFGLASIASFLLGALVAVLW